MISGEKRFSRKSHKLSSASSTLAPATYKLLDRYTTYKLLDRYKMSSIYGMYLCPNKVSYKIKLYYDEELFQPIIIPDGIESCFNLIKESLDKYR